MKGTYNAIYLTQRTEIIEDAPVTFLNANYKYIKEAAKMGATMFVVIDEDTEEIFEHTLMYMIISVGDVTENDVFSGTVVGLDLLNPGFTVTYICSNETDDMQLNEE